MVGIGNHFQSPGFAGESDFALLFIRKGMRHWLAARNVLKLIERREIRFELVDGFSQLGCLTINGAWPKPRCGDASRTQTYEVASRQLTVLAQESRQFVHGRPRTFRMEEPRSIVNRQTASNNKTANGWGQDEGHEQKEPSQFALT